METYQPRGMYFEEFEVGQRFISAGRTITESDIVTFAGLSGDYNRIHTDAQYCQDSPFGERIAHGLLVLSIASGLVAQSGMIEGTVIAFREISNWKFIKPVLIGDTVHVATEVLETKFYRRLESGKVEIELSVINQDDDVVMKGTWNVLMASQEV